MIMLRACALVFDAMQSIRSGAGVFRRGGAPTGADGRIRQELAPTGRVVTPPRPAGLLVAGFVATLMSVPASSPAFAAVTCPASPSGDTLANETAGTCTTGFNAAVRGFSLVTNSARVILFVNGTPTQVTSPSGPCHIDGIDLYPDAAGTCTFTISYTDPNGSPISTTSISVPVVAGYPDPYFDRSFSGFTVSGGGFDAGAANTITFATPADTVINATAPTLAASASSGAAVTYTSNTTGVCTISGSTLSLVSVGTCSITASQAATGNYVAAASVTRTFQVLAAAPTVTGVGPPAGPAAGGTSVTITGTWLTGATAVHFGAAAATSVTVNSATSITATAPAGNGTVDVTVTTPGGTSATSAADRFTYFNGPTVTNLSPNTGPTAGGTSVTITGTNLSGATAVKFGAAAAASFTAVSTTSITATAPGGTGTVDVTVTTPGGTSATSAADRFSYYGGPTVTGVSPNVGPTAGGTSVTITGTNLLGATAVKFGAAAATSFTAVSATAITAMAPAGTGTVDITVTTPGGTSATSATGQFTYYAAPAVTTVSPNAGPTAGATRVTITGTNLLGATAVYFGAVAATSVTVHSATAITATAPAGTGTVDVTVTTPGGTSATSAADRFSYYGGPAVTGVSPNAGPTAGATSVTITGTNLLGATAVKFGTAAATSFTPVGATAITATAPAGTGTVDITVTTPGGTSATSAADRFTYYGGPAVTGLSPGTGPAAGGTTVTITGSNLAGATAVTFGAAAASFTVVGANAITATSPAGTGTVDVTVTTPGGATAASAASKFAYVSATTTTIRSSHNPSDVGQAVTFTATVTPASSGTPAGTITFKDGATTIGTAALASGAASVTTSVLARGSHSITASFGGNANFAPSTSAVLMQTVDLPADSLRLRALQVAATRFVAQGSGQAITNAVGDALADAFGGGGALITPSGNGLHVDLSAQPGGPDSGAIRSAAAPASSDPANAVSAYAPREGRTTRVDEVFSTLDRSTLPTKAAARAQQPPPDWMAWANVSAFGIDRWSHRATLTGGQVNALVGISHRLAPSVVVGILGGYESFRYDSQEFTGRLRGDGWTTGSYLGWMIVPGLRFDVSAAYSGIDYDASAGQAAGRFDGTRWLVSSGLTGTATVEGFVIQPSANVFALWEHENAYTDTLGTDQAERTFTTGRASAGGRIAYPWTYAPGTTLSPYVGLFCDYYFSGDDATVADAELGSFPLLQGWSARGSAGLGATFASGAALALGAELGGIGSTTMLWTYHVRGRVPF
jgi:hypothetical protein